MSAHAAVIDAGDTATVDPQERVDALLAHLTTRREGLSSREAGSVATPPPHP